MRRASLFWLLRSQMIKSNLQKEWAHTFIRHTSNCDCQRYYCCKTFLSDSASLALHGGRALLIPDVYGYGIWKASLLAQCRKRLFWLCCSTPTGARPGGSGFVIEEWVTGYSIIEFGGFAVQCRPYLLVSKYLVMNEFLPITLQVWIKIPVIHKFNLALRKKLQRIKVPSLRENSATTCGRSWKCIVCFVKIRRHQDDLWLHMYCKLVNLICIAALTVRSKGTVICVSGLFIYDPPASTRPIDLRGCPFIT